MNEAQHVDPLSPAPILDAPAVCLPCSAFGAVGHKCEEPDECPCSSPLCGVMPRAD